MRIRQNVTAVSQTHAVSTDSTAGLAADCWPPAPTTPAEDLNRMRRPPGTVFRSGSATDGRSNESRASLRASAVVRVVTALVLCLAAVTASVPTAEATGVYDSPIQPRPAAGDHARADSGAGCGVDIEASTGTPTTHRIVELYPNPPTGGNVGEYLVVESPLNATVPLTVSDGYATATIPAERPGGRVAVSLNPNVTETLTDYPVVELEGYLRPAADGEELTLASGGETIETVGYDRAPDGEVWYRESGESVGTNRSIHRGEWWP